MQWECQICGYIHDEDEPPSMCPICGAPASQFSEWTDDDDSLNGVEDDDDADEDYD